MMMFKKIISFPKLVALNFLAGFLLSCFLCGGKTFATRLWKGHDLENDNQNSETCFQKHQKKLFKISDFFAISSSLLIRNENY